MHQDDFWDFVYQAVVAQYLRPGDIFVCDNAAIHAGADIIPALQELLELNRIELRFLPAYSPEFNPAELVFGFVKNYLRNYRDPALRSLEEDITLCIQQDHTSANAEVLYQVLSQIFIIHLLSPKHIVTNHIVTNHIVTKPHCHIRGSWFVVQS